MARTDITVNLTHVRQMEELAARHVRLADSRARWRAVAVFAIGLSLAASILAVVGWFG